MQEGVSIDAMSQVRVLISAVERSGDEHAANFVREVRRVRPEVEFEGFGGELLAAAGCRIHADLIAVASMALGFLGHLPRYFSVVRQFDRLLRETRPDAVVFVDSPGFHFILARLAKWRGIPVVYYICPQIWAWAPWRRRKVLRYTDLLLTILPFEERLYHNDKVAVRFVGHPLGDELASYPEGEGRRLREALDIAPDTRVVGLLPGSRSKEVTRLMPVFRRTLDSLAEEGEEVVAVVSGFRQEFEPTIGEAMEGSPTRWHLVTDDVRSIIQASDVLLVASGTVSLQVAYFERPMFVVYWASRFEQLFYRHFVVTPYFSLPNILGASLTADGAAIVPELLCRGHESGHLAEQLRRFLLDESLHKTTREHLASLRERYLAPGASERAAADLVHFLDALTPRDGSQEADRSNELNR